MKRLRLRVGAVLGAALTTAALAIAPAHATTAAATSGGAASVHAAGVVTPAGIVPGGNWYKTKKTCEARGRYLMAHPPPNMFYSGFYCIKNPTDDRWSLLMESPDVGCIVAPSPPGESARLLAVEPADC